MATQRQFEAVNQEQVDQALEHKRFIHKSRCACGFMLHTFTRPGEFIEGRLRPCYNHDQADRAACAHIHYQTVTGQDATVAIRLSKSLRQAVDKETSEKPRLWGHVVRITYKGSIATKFGHAEKVYLVEVDRGSITPDFKGVENGRAKNAKPRQRRAIRRPGFEKAAGH